MVQWLLSGCSETGCVSALEVCLIGNARKLDVPFLDFDNS